MRSRTGNSLSTLMFMVPLLGVPLMAIFGVPQFVPVIASSVSEKPTVTPKNRFNQGVGESVSAPSFVIDSSSHDFGFNGGTKLQDVFQAADRPRRDSRPFRDSDSRNHGSSFVETSLNSESRPAINSLNEPKSKGTQSLNDLFGEPIATEAESESIHQSQSPSRRVATEPVPARSLALLAPVSERSDVGLTWREAVLRLNELGIQNFRLEPGSRHGDFYFACEFAPHRDARVTRRFEAEAAEPLLAVRAVLRQIDDWLPRR